MKYVPIVVWSFLSFPVFAEASDRLVPSQYPTIQAAISSSNDGDTILVAAGTYTEVIDFLGKAITVRGSTTSPGTRILNGTGFSTSVVLCMNGEWTDTVLEGFTVRGGSGKDIGGYSYGGGLYARYASPTIRHCVFENNIADAGGGVALHGSVSAISHCLFRNNEATVGGYFGGGGLFSNGGSPKIYQCTFENNVGSVLAKGGGISLFLGFPEISNCLIANNVARHGGGIMNQKSSPTITNVTIVNNHATGYGGGYNAFYPSAISSLTNVIVWGNSAGNTGDEILDQSGAVTTVRHSLVGGGWNGAGQMILDADPQFVGGQTSNYRLASESPAIDFGDSAAVPSYISTDLDGNPRIIGQAADLGPYENQDPGVPPTCSGDFNQDGQIGSADLLLLLSSWGACSGCEQDLSHDGLVNFLDLILLLNSWGGC